jgi:NAD(P)-dependent dehydrogenase (short-subunit alcohol dehydrogenase family)
MKNQNERNESVASEQKVAVVTGSSSGIGYATALQLARSGYLVFATMRNPEKRAALSRSARDEKLPLQVEQLDVTDQGSIKAFMNKMGGSIGRIDVLVNNAGYFTLGSLEDHSIEEIQNQLDTNLLGTIRVTQAVLPVMRAQKSGTIVNVSSVVGRFGLPGMSAYVATKFALEGVSESLAYEVAPFGIKVIMIEPGVVKTKVFDNLVVAQGAQRQDSPYSGMIKGLNETFGFMLEHATTQDQVAAVILKAVSSQKPSFRYPVGQDATGWLEKKSEMTDEQFQEYMANSMALAPRQI